MFSLACVIKLKAQSFFRGSARWNKKAGNNESASTAWINIPIVVAFFIETTNLLAANANVLPFN